MKVAEAMDSKPKISTSKTVLSMSACAALTRIIAKMMIMVTEQKKKHQRCVQQGVGLSFVVA